MISVILFSTPSSLLPLTGEFLAFQMLDFVLASHFPKEIISI
jgi:hypothetical protein